MNFWKRRNPLRFPGLEVSFDANQRKLLIQGSREPEVQKVTLQGEMKRFGHPRSHVQLHEMVISDLHDPHQRIPEHLPGTMKVLSYRISGQSNMAFLSESIEVIWTVHIDMQGSDGSQERLSGEVFLLPYKLPPHLLGMLWLMRSDVGKIVHR